MAGADAEARRRQSHAVSVPADWRSIFTGNAKALGRHGLGLFLQPAGVPEDDSRYIVLTLSFDSQGEDKPLPWIDGWRCVFDTKTGQFSIPSDFADHNAKAVEFPVRRRR